MKLPMIDPRSHVDSIWRASGWRVPARTLHGGFSVKPRDNRVRPLPFPYRGALAISNDAEYMNLEFFEVLMRFLNTRDDTPLGRGLGLRVTSSLFFYSASADNLSYFDGLGADSRRSGAAGRLEAYLRAGLLDTMHAYGDFDGVGGCTRAHAERAWRELDDLGVRLEVFSNHGGIANVQNIGLDAKYHQGDQPGADAYHVDIMARHGVRYIWTDSMVVSEHRPSGLVARLRHLLKPRRHGLLAPTKLADGNDFLGFERVRGTGIYAPNLASLGTQVSGLDWAALYRGWGTVVLYQHLGVLERQAGRCVASTVDRVRMRPEVYLMPFRILEQEQAEGRLWVAGCAELLRYVEMVEGATLVEDQERGCVAVRFPRLVDQPVEFFAGLTLAADPRRPLVIRYGETVLPFAWNGPEAVGGTYSVTVLRTEARLPW